MCYAGSDQPIAPIDDPGQMFQKLYGGSQERQIVASVLDRVREDLNRVSSKLSMADRRLLQEHMENVRKLELDIAGGRQGNRIDAPGARDRSEIELVNDNTPAISRMQIESACQRVAERHDSGSQSAVHEVGRTSTNAMARH